MTLPPDAFRDFCLWPYEPPAIPVAGAADGQDMLLALVDAAGGDGAWRDIAAALRRDLGSYATVWGLKQSAAGLSVELYFYDYARLGRGVSIGRVATALAGLVPCALPVDETIPYFMFSFELPLRGAATAVVDAVDIYIGNPGSAVSSGICYRHDGRQAELKSFYFFFDREADWDDIVDKLCCSAQLPMRLLEVETILPPWLTACRRIVVANKRGADGIYCSGLGVENLLRFAGHAGFPAAIRDGLQALAPRLGHMKFDVGFDMAVQDSRAVLAKSSFYGVL
jgi:hypothetical protein